MRNQVLGRSIMDLVNGSYENHPTKEGDIQISLQDDAEGGGEAQPLVLANVGGVFIVLVAGSAMAVICAFLEMIVDVWMISHKMKVNQISSPIFIYPSSIINQFYISKSNTKLRIQYTIIKLTIGKLHFLSFGLLLICSKQE